MGLALFAHLSGEGYAAEGLLPGNGIEFFERKIRPLLADRCYSCHGEEKQKGQLRLDSFLSINAGGEHGQVLTPGDPGKSKLWIAVSYEDPDLQMPPKKPLSEREKADLRAWIAAGAPMPTNAPSAAPALRPLIGEKERAHWAFQPIRRRDLASVTPSRRAANPVDAFLDEALSQKGITANPPASRRELIRRATFDLTGLPPTAEEIDAFVNDPSPRAWEAVIDRLLASPHYGEKWGRHWLDLVRFAESNSYERDGGKPNAWRYRDYVIRSFNRDNPYDQFIREQLAGDELPNPSSDAIIATGYYRLGIWDDEPADRDLAQYDSLDDLVTTTGQVFLGLTIDCARCHNHKLDPISQRDYYRMVAFFHNIAPYKNGGPTDERRIYQAEEERRELGIDAATTNLLALSVSESGPKPPETFILMRGNPNLKGDKVEPGFLEILTTNNPVIPAVATSASSTGRRTALATWLTDPQHPLTARVWMNRVWQHHFGRGLVRSPNNFGMQGDRPTNPDLLDWLASELIKSGWKLKPIHRLLMTSQAYQRSSKTQAEGVAKDLQNDLFWRFEMRRLTAEETRDSILAITGCLNQRMYGPSIYVDIPKEVLAGQSVPGNGWGKSSFEEQNRRSIYIYSKRSLITPILESFDVAETDRSAPVRFSTTQPTQALGMLNGSFLNDQAVRFAARLKREAGNDPTRQVKFALQWATSRVPTENETRRGVALLESLRKTENHSASDEQPDRALNYFCLMTLNLNELMYLD